MRYLAGLLLVLGTNGYAFADTITVTSTSDAGPGSLRQALLSAAPGDTIEFAVTGTITLASRLSIDRNVRITGPGADRLTISGAGDFAVGGILTLTAPFSEISGVTFALARANTCGGAIRVETGAALNITDSTLSNNSSFLQGGAICNHGSVTAIRCQIVSNSANVAGGGIYNDGGMYVADSTITKGSSNAGGGVASAGTTYLVGVTVANNTAIFGGGLHSSEGLTDVRFSSIAGNLAGSDGGGAWQQGGQVDFLNTTISSNQASNGSGGGTFVKTGTLLVLNSTYFDNFAWVNGGGISIDLKFASLDVTHATVAKNRTLGTGGGLYSPSAVLAANALNVNNTILAGQQFFGGNCAVPGGTGTSRYNLSDDGSCATLLAHFSDRHLTPAGLDPLGLRDNGGPTKTVTLAPGSAAIDAVPIAVCRYINVPVTIDQRNLPRPIGSACDTGAVEVAAVEVIDLTPPVLHVPDNLIADATSPQGATVAFDVSASDPDDAAGPVACTPASGSLFSLGTTPVQCSATDTHGNTGTASFTVTVLTPSQTIARLTTASATAGLQQSTGLLQNALAAIARGNLVSACNQLEAFQRQVRAQTGKSITQAVASALLKAADNAQSGLACR